MLDGYIELLIIIYNYIDTLSESIIVSTQVYMHIHIILFIYFWVSLKTNLNLICFCCRDYVRNVLAVYLLLYVFIAVVIKLAVLCYRLLE